MAAAKKIVLKVDFDDNRGKTKALKILCTVHGVETIAVDMKGQNITVIGTVDPVHLIYKLRKNLFPTAQIVSVEVKKDKEVKDNLESENHSSATSEVFTIEYLNRITNAFSEERIIGRGRYGVVYKGVLENGKYIAVKKLHPSAPSAEDFKNELNNLMGLHHQNIVRFIGYCYHLAQVIVEHNGEYVPAIVEERALCFEYLRGGSLADMLLSDECGGLDWNRRYKIIKEICNGLDYLHNGSIVPIYHLDLKPSNILLDEDMVPKIGESGLSRLLGSAQTHSTTKMIGTPGYMPPEYIDEGLISSKFDVFSLGVMIIQIMVGNENCYGYADIPPEEFIELAYEYCVKRMQATMSKHTSHEVRTCIEIALKCVESDRVKRPTINEIVQRLNKYMTTEFTFEFLKHITNGFSEQNIVGRGGYGVIYTGVLDNEEIVVKKLHQMMWIDDEEFKNELNNLMRVQHKNIVRLVGYCHHTSQICVEYKGELVSASVVERAICMEYLLGGSLDKQLSDEPCILDWSKCYEIIKGICEGLNYLHNESSNPILHLDLKPANILLDKDMQPKIGDFGLSRLFDSLQTDTTASQNVKGTRGYMPPEYIDRQKISPKFDTFSLGVIIIQIMAGKKGYFDCPYTPPKKFIKLVRENWRNRLQAEMSSRASEEVRTCIEIALKCVEADRVQRPSIADIVNELNKIGSAKSSAIRQWSEKLMALKTLLSFTHFKYWLFLLVTLIAIILEWPRFCHDSWCRGT